MKIIAHIRTDFPEKFGLPRQSGLVKELKGRIIFEPKYRNPEAVRGLSEFSHIWLLWGFSHAENKSEWSPTVRPPRLGGNKRVGVFATRSPFRPNPIGLSSVKLDDISFDKKYGPVIHVSGIDMTDMTPIYDIKPYLAYVDSHPDATDGFASKTVNYSLQVNIPDKFLDLIPGDYFDEIYGILRNDPRPSYQNDAERIYGLKYKNLEIKFKVSDNILTVCDISLFPTE